MPDSEKGMEKGTGKGLNWARSRGRVQAAVAVVSDRIVDIAPRIPVRDLETLRRQFPGLGAEELADRLVAGAVKGSSTVGAGVGAAAMLPVPPAMPAELATEIVGVAAIEIKLIAELHEVYGLRAPGSGRPRSMAYVMAWSEERGVDPMKLGALSAVFGAKMRRELRHRVFKRTLRNLPMLTPFLLGAAAGAWMNRRDTRKLAAHVRADLRRRQVSWDALGAGGDEAALTGPERHGGGALPPGRA
jgi:hypothetical protein